MRIAFASELFYPHIGGCEKRFFELGKNLARRGHEIHVFTVQYDRRLPVEELFEGIHIHRFALNEKYVTHNGRSINGVVRYSLESALRLISSEFDVYYFNEWPLIHGFLSRPFCRPFVQEWCEIWTGKVQLLQKLLSKITGHHVTVSEFTKNRLVNLLRVEPDEIEVIPDGINCHDSYPLISKRQFGRLVYVGRLASHKRLDLLLDAFKQVQREISPVELHIIGAGPSSPKIEMFASKDPDIHYHGLVSERAKLCMLMSSWIFITMSEREGFGIAPLEAMAAGVPVIVADFPNNATKNLVYDSHGGGIVSSPQTKDVAKGISELLNDESRWNETSKAAFRFAKSYDWDLIAEKMERYLKQVATW